MIIIAVFATVIFTLLWSFGAFHTVDFSNHNPNPSSIEKSAAKGIASTVPTETNSPAAETAAPVPADTAAAAAH